ncbi:hypothetical protein DLJ53_26580 [Acuticoccus sediminis]|uniref:Uncharacterized protein n=1 Tax=Acuticoccus sediminis TaxID=2184697 RepID=A0A8B2NN39_9HYPH|nr:hypothetical protein DLJ53_26580 [Acuticoccus sediminis]
MIILGAALLSGATDAAAEVVNVECVFDMRRDADGTKSDRMELHYKLDKTTGRAILEGNAGLSDVVLHMGTEGFSFIEVTESGAVMTTTVVISTGRAVHSRNTVIVRELVESQYLGRCSW